jgi:signal transduction histidine kinase
METTLVNCAGNLASLRRLSLRVANLTSVELAAPTGGAVKVRAQVFEEDPGFLRVEVSDTGCGISPDMTEERIFEHLYRITDPGQAGRKGLGLGLYISKKLVTRQGVSMQA